MSGQVKWKAVATASETDTERMELMSMTIPSVEERPAKQCPPLRVAVRNLVRLANEIVVDTSSGFSHSTMARGLTSWKRAMAGLRAES